MKSIFLKKTVYVPKNNDKKMQIKTYSDCQAALAALCDVRYIPRNTSMPLSISSS